MQVNKIIKAARACIGTPFVPQGRDPALGLDCAGLILHAYAAAGITLTAPADYPFPPPGDLLTKTLAQLGFVPAAGIQPGMLLLFRFGGQAQHLAIAASTHTMIHAYAPVGHVVETSIGAAWLPRLLNAYVYKDQHLPARVKRGKWSNI